MSMYTLEFDSGLGLLIHVELPNLLSSLAKVIPSALASFAFTN